MPEITFKNGNLYLDAEVYDTYFESFDAAVLLQRDDTIYLMPVQQAAGGLLIKLRNARGDRVIHAIEFFQTHGFESDTELRVTIAWDSSLHALALKFG